ncbi:MAG: hypothetical protein ABSA47_18315 [Verrucomicrobiota bacterium]|jgi:hypothetical protein
MSIHHKAPGPHASTRRGARLRLIGALVLALGLAAAGLVYLTGPPPEADLSSDPSTAKAYKRDLRDTEINFGRTGVIVNELWADLQRPGAQAVLITAFAVLAASGCFYFARLLDIQDQPR